MTVFLALVCPWCGELPYVVMGGGTQAFCANDKCDALIWNPSITAAANLANLHMVQIRSTASPAALAEAGWLASLTDGELIAEAIDAETGDDHAQLGER